MMRDPIPEVTSASPLDVLSYVTRLTWIHAVMLGWGLSLDPCSGSKAFPS